jgi:Novel STAND NTPase 1
MAPFTADDADKFFARDRWTRIVVANVIGSRLTILYGQSGVGKTSLLQAGLQHELLKRSLARASRSRPQITPIVFREWQTGSLAPLLERVNEAMPPVAEAPTPVNGNGEPPLLGALRRLTTATGGRVVLILDQFEEYLLYHGRDEDIGSVPRQLAFVIDADALPVSVVVAIREDAVPRLDLVKRSIPRLFDNTLRLDPVGQSEAEAAITGPIDWYNTRQDSADTRVKIDPKLVAAVLEVAAGGLNGQVWSGTRKVTRCVPSADRCPRSRTWRSATGVTCSPWRWRTIPSSS